MAFSTGPSDRLQINQRLGRGINMGNMFEAPSEDAWGNPWRSGYFRRIADLGFQHVRVPVRWEPSQRSMAQPPYTISPEFLQRIQEVVHEAQANQLMVVLNMHHHEELNSQEFFFDVLTPGDIGPDTRIVLDVGHSSHELRVDGIRLEAITADGS